MQSPYFSLITGASMGIGKAMAEECAARGMHLILVALPGNDLEQVGEDIRRNYGVTVHCIGLDLTDAAAPKQLLAFCQEKELSVNMLINNAGFGASGAFVGASSDFYEQMMQLNVVNTVLLTRTFLPELQRHPQAYILNTGSAAAFFDMPYKLVYSATKTFIYSFSRALCAELKHTAIKVAVVCPGGVNTNEEVRKRTEQMGWFARKVTLEPEFVAQKAIQGLLRGKPLILPGAVAKLYYTAAKIIPYSLKMTILTRIYKKAA